MTFSFIVTGHPTRNSDSILPIENQLHKSTLDSIQSSLTSSIRPSSLKSRLIRLEIQFNPIPSSSNSIPTADPFVSGIQIAGSDGEIRPWPVDFVRVEFQIIGRLRRPLARWRWRRRRQPPSMK